MRKVKKLVLGYAQGGYHPTEENDAAIEKKVNELVAAVNKLIDANRKA